MATTATAGEGTEAGATAGAAAKQFGCGKCYSSYGSNCCVAAATATASTAAAATVAVATETAPTAAVATVAAVTAAVATSVSVVVALATAAVLQQQWQL